MLCFCGAGGRKSVCGGIGVELRSADLRSEHRNWYKDKRDHDGTVFGDGIGKKVLCERFVVIWPPVVGMGVKKVEQGR